MNCLNCSQPVKGKSYKYCSNRCQFDFQSKEYIRRWKAGLESGRTGKTSLQLSKYIKKYLIEKYGEKCCQCGWSEKHPLTGKVPVKVDHRDGNAENNNESNLRLLCLNCHSLTLTFRFFNKGKGRSSRRKATLAEGAANSISSPAPL